MFDPKVRIYYQNKHLKRNGRGFSHKELIQAGLSVDEALWMGIPVDVKRKSLYEDNVETIMSIIDYIKAIQEQVEEEKKLEAAEAAERPKADKKKEKKPKAEKKEPKKAETKPTKVETKPVEEKKTVEKAPSTESVPLAMIPGVGPKTAERLAEAGYESATDIAKASVEDLEKIKGISKKSAAEIIDKAKEL